MFLQIETRLHPGRAVKLKELDELIDIFAGITDRKKMALLFDEIFTPSELNTLRLRWMLLKMLNEGIPQREIASTLRVSLCKITRGSKLLKNSESILNEILSNFNKKGDPDVK